MTESAPIDIKTAFETQGVIAIEAAFDAAARPVLTVTLSDGSIQAIEPTQEAFEALIARHRAGGLFHGRMAAQGNDTIRLFASFA